MSSSAVSAGLITVWTFTNLARAVNCLPFFKMRRAAGVALLLLIGVSGLPSASAQSARRRSNATTAVSATPGPLAERLRHLLDDPPFDRALWGIAIVDPSGRLVFERNGDRLFVPASNAKLVVSAVATALLPPDFRFRTSVYVSGAVRDSVITGDLVLYGRGDPSLSNRSYPDRLSAFAMLADSLHAVGLRRVAGDLIGDASYFDSVTIHPSWESYDLSWWYAAPVSALAFNDNSVDFRISPTIPGAAPRITFEPDLGMVQFSNVARTVPVDSPRTMDFRRLPGTNVIRAEGDVPADARPWSENVSVNDGAAWAAAAFRRALTDAGISVTGLTRTTYDPGATAAARANAPLAELRSPPLHDLLEPILRVSHNWYAEMLLKTLGRELRGVGSWDSGLAVERRFLRDSMKVDTTQFNLADGSGLSHWNLVTPRALVQLLLAMSEHPRFKNFREALPLAGSTGTLRGRYRANGLAGRVRAKTGSIANVNTLSGYLETGSGTWTFSIQLNNHAARNREALKRIDEIVAAIAPAGVRCEVRAVRC
jgi:D-alanyl-D-alanine carboxypeptidase/D-alanyl-D-alanine-endopeptidase (penicillin-binding protein 4)